MSELTKAERARLVRLLRVLQEHLESAIDAAVPDGATEPREAWVQLEIMQCRHQWKQCEEMAKRLEEK